MECKGLLETKKMLHKGRDYCLWQTVKHMRDRFEDGYSDTARWVKNWVIIPEELKKCSPEMIKTMKTVICSGKSLLPEHDRKDNNYEDWK